MAMEEARSRQAKKEEDGDHNNDDNDGLNMPINTFFRPNSIRFLLNEIARAYLRRYRLRDSAMELFFLPSGGSSCFSASNILFVDFGAGHVGNSRRDEDATFIMRCTPQNTLKQFPEKSARFLREQLQKVTTAWDQGSRSTKT